MLERLACRDPRARSPSTAPCSARARDRGSHRAVRHVEDGRPHGWRDDADGRQLPRRGPGALDDVLRRRRHGRFGGSMHEAGGEVVMGPMDLPVGRMAVVKDPHGAVSPSSSWSRPTRRPDRSSTPGARSLMVRPRWRPGRSRVAPQAVHDVAEVVADADHAKAGVARLPARPGSAWMPGTTPAWPRTASHPGGQRGVERVPGVVVARAAGRRRSRGRPARRRSRRCQARRGSPPPTRPRPWSRSSGCTRRRRWPSPRTTGRSGRWRRADAEARAPSRA